MQKILNLIWKATKLFIICLPIVIGARCTQLGIGAMFGSDPTMDQIEASCKARIADGDYEWVSPAKRLGACVEDSYLSMGGAGIFGLVFTICGAVLLLLGFLWLRKTIKKGI